MITAQTVRDLLKTRQHLQEAGFAPDAPAIISIQTMVERYRARAGMMTYLSQMLGPLAIEPADEARFYDENGAEMGLHGDGRIIDLLRTCERLPWVVKVGDQVRYT